MFIVLDTNNKLVEAKDAIKGCSYFCPVCKKPVLAKFGKTKAKHFAHIHSEDCPDKWNYDMSEWHRVWQEKYPIENREVVMSANGKIHRADICTGKYVIEFQHSYIKPDEVKERNEFYVNCGYKVIWLFDMIEKVEEHKIYVDEDGIRSNGRQEYIWKWASNSLNTVVPQVNADVVICFQFSENEVLQVLRSDWLGEEKADYRMFTAGKNKIDLLSETSIEEMFQVNQKRIQKERKEIEDYRKMLRASKETAIRNEKGLYDPLVSFLGKNKEHRIYPCFKNEKYSVESCLNCVYHSYKKESRCMYRFKDVAPETVKKIVKDENRYIVKIIYEDGKVESFRKVNSLWRSLYDLWRIYGPLKIARVQNMRTHKYAQIVHDPKVQKEEYGFIQGKISSDGRHFSQKYFNIYDAEKPVWKMEWFLKKDTE